MYFNEENIMHYCKHEPDTKSSKDGHIFLYDGLFCEYAYVHNKDNDTLEIYRGFFHTPQIFEQHELSADNEKYYVHLIFIADRKIHNKNLVLAAMQRYIDQNENSKDQYPERKVINVCEGCWEPLETGKQYHNDDCKGKVILRKI